MTSGRKVEVASTKRLSLKNYGANKSKVREIENKD